MTGSTGILSLLLLFPQADSRGELTSLVEKFLAAASRRDAPAALALMTADSPQREVLEKAIREHEGDIREGGVEAFDIRGDQAYATVRFRGRLIENDATYAGESLTLWRGVFRREGGAWKWQDLRPAGFDLALEIAAVRSERQLRDLLEARKPELGTRAFYVLSTAIQRLALNGDPEEGRRILKIAEAAAEYSGNDRYRLDILVARCSIQVQLERPGSAMRLVDEAVERSKTVDAPFVVSQVHSLRALALLDTGSCEEALRESDAAIRLVEARGDSVALISAHHVAGMAWVRSGMPRPALERFARAAAMAKRMKKNNSLIEVLGEQAMAHSLMGDHGAARDAAIRALDLLDGSKHTVHRAKLLTILGQVYQVAGDFPKAKAVFGEAVELWSLLKVPRQVGVALIWLGTLRHAEGKLNEAGGALTEAIKLLEESGDSASLAIALSVLGGVLHDLGDYAGAESRCKSGAAAAVLAKETTGRVIALCQLSELLLHRREFGEALGMAEEALKLAEERGSPLAGYSARLAVGDALRRRKQPGDLVRAVEVLRKAGELLERSRSGLRDPSLQQGFLAHHFSLYAEIALHLHDLERDPEAFSTSEEAKARTLTDLLESGAARIVKAMSAEERAEEERRMGTIRLLEVQLEKTYETDPRDALEKRIAEGRLNLEAFRNAVYARHPGLETSRARFACATLEDINRRLLSGPPRSAMLSYLQNESETLLFVLTPGARTASLLVRVIPASKAALRTRVDAFHTACASPGADYRLPARELFDLLLPPDVDAALVEQNIEHLIVVPDGVLHEAPFQALVDRSGKHLIERWSLTRAPSATALMKMEEIAERRRAQGGNGLTPMLAVGAPVMPEGFGPLAHAEREIVKVAKRYGGTALVGAEATESKVKQLLGGARRIHLATHGSIDEGSPMYSFLVLTRDAAEDGRLEAREFLDLELRADLVVLSACRTAMGRRVEGEGILGLAWSLFAAGAPATLVSQWQVIDESDGGLIEAFYDALGPGVSFAEALRAAQRKLLKNPQRSHPYFWAPFILMGAGRS